MKRYETEQKKLIVALFRSAPERAFTADEVARILGGDDGERTDRLCSVSTVYRLIARLCEDGVLCKRAREGSRKFYYQYVSGGACESHLHLECTACGRVIHMDDSTSERMLLTVLQKSGFRVDPARTRVPGLCFDCRDGKVEGRK